MIWLSYMSYLSFQFFGSSNLFVLPKITQEKNNKWTFYAYYNKYAIL